MPSRYVYLNDDTYARLVYIAQQKNQKLNEVLRECIEIGLKIKEKELAEK